jgi:L-malate glycosyltransferase
MKIAYVYDAVYPYCKGGGERRIQEIATRLHKRGHEVHIFGMKLWDGPRLMEKDGLHYHGVCPSLNLYHPSGRRSIREIVEFGAYSARMLAAERFDVVDCGQWPFTHHLPVRLQTWMRRSKMFVSWYEVWGQHWLEYIGKLGHVGLAVEKTFCRIPDGIIAVSEVTSDDLVALGVKPGVVRVIPNGIDYRHIRSVQAAEGRSYDVVCTGRLKNHKNVDVLLRAIALANREIPGITGLIIGEGPERDRLQTLAAELGLAGQVTFTGGLEDFNDLLRLMKTARIFVNASTKEGGGSITLFEANACGLPVIAVRSPHGIDPRLILEGENGYMVDALSPELLASEMVLLLSDPERLARNSAASVRMAEQYDWEFITDQHEELYSGTWKAARN